MKSESETGRCAALVLAADRHADDAVASAAGAACKALAPVGGVPMVHRVIRSLRTSRLVGRISLVGPARDLLRRDAELEHSLADGSLGWLENASSPSASAARALEGAAPGQPVLLTTADHALLSPAIVDHFLEQALASDCDFVVGVARLDTVQARYPDTRRTAIRLRGGPYCGCNLFAFTSGRGRELATFWRRVEQERKRPWRVIAGALGPAATLRYLLGRLTLEQALAQLSRKLGVKIGAVVLPFAEAAIDVDSRADLDLVERILAQRSTEKCVQP
ncbi:NTP transferase domain-containing protein [Azotobacter chroococcum]|uniref:NTP transferase domain-containing protein n=1 Tax=Azotobacter chroococcum TaxID=353 RepID=UPI0010ADF974|nr:NTP transferase domain-containing protein [Azotobacter chroococcum]TKD37157.1 MobA-like NTP transferase domain containing protein [Azotobacter chroococcum]